MGSRDKGLPSGQIVAKRYRIERVVGQGGMGAVYHATQTDTGVPVALKLLLKHFSSSEVELKRFQREAALVQRIRHPNIVQLLDFGTTEKDQAFIAFELLDGQSLNQVLKEQGPIPSRWVASIARNLLEGLAAAHAQDVLHRDIKPGNVFLLRGSWKAKLLDFGVAKAVRSDAIASTQLTEDGQMVGTPHYMAPEQVKGGTVSLATDVYALGLVMAEMLQGKRVIESKGVIDVYMAHIGPEPHRFGPEVAASPLAPIVQRATTKDPASRYPNAAAMLHALDLVLRQSHRLASSPSQPAIRASASSSVAPHSTTPASFHPSSSYPASASVPAPNHTAPMPISSDEMDFETTSVVPPKQRPTTTSSGPPPGKGLEGTVMMAPGANPLDVLESTRDLSSDELARLRALDIPGPASRGAVGGETASEPIPLTNKRSPAIIVAVLVLLLGAAAGAYFMGLF